MIPEIAIIGHPNEGKSSVLSTLAEDDSVRISPVPGETTQCRTFPVIVDGREMIRFTDTPGFQNPARVLREMKKHPPGGNPLDEFMSLSRDIKELHDDRELLGPVQRGAGIIYVVDGSRPVRNVDRAEMEILRLTGKPRMAIINSKQEDDQYLPAWKNEFRQNFNANRIFNAHRATYAERISLLEALKAIDQDWQPILSEIVAAFKKDWAARNATTTDIIVDLLSSCLSLSVKENISDNEDISSCRKRLFNRYTETIVSREIEAHRQIRSLYKHNIFNYKLPSHSILEKDLFDERTWQLMGLTRKQLVIAGGLGGAAVGAGLEVAAFGHGLGLFTAVGTVAGALGAMLGGESVATRMQELGIPLGGEQLQIGPAKEINLLFVLLNRSLLYYQHTINWAHGRRDYQPQSTVSPDSRASIGFTADWPTARIRRCQQFFKAVTAGKTEEAPTAKADFQRLLLRSLQEISESE